MIIDTHCHLDDPAFADLRETLRTALTHDVWGVIAVGCDAETNAHALAAAGAAPKSVWACLGFHPDWTQLTDADLDLVAAQLAVHHSRIVGLGEVGLPWYSLEGRADAAALLARGRARLDVVAELLEHATRRGVVRDDRRVDPLEAEAGEAEGVDHRRDPRAQALALRGGRGD